MRSSSSSTCWSGRYGDTFNQLYSFLQQDYQKHKKHKSTYYRQQFGTERALLAFKDNILHAINVAP